MDYKETIINYYQKKRTDFGRPVQFEDTEVTVLINSKPNALLSEQYVERKISNKAIQAIPDKSEHFTNTMTKDYQSQGMIHLEGGWPKNVNPMDLGSKTQYQKKIEKLEGYLKTLKCLTDPVIGVLNQNIALDMYQDYYPSRTSKENEPNTSTNQVSNHEDDMDWSYEKPSATILTVFKDPSSLIQKRTASCISWYPNDFARVAVSYCAPQSEKKSEDQIDLVNSYIWNVQNPNQPEMTLSPTSPLTCIAYNPKDTSCLVGGAYNGTIFLFDTRRGSFSVDYSHMHVSHRDPVYDMKWVQSKHNNECVSVSTDGLILVWDVRNLGQPIERHTLKQKEGGAGGATVGTSAILGAISMEYDTSYSTSKFLIGTEQGVVVSWNRKSKKKTERMYFGHHGSVYSVQRSPFLPKYFLSIGDWTARIWHDDLWKSPIMETKYHESYITSGCWSPLKPGVFFTAKMDGTMDVWDYCHNQGRPVVSLTLSDHGLYSIKSSVGKYVAVGAADGSVSFVELSDDLSERTSSDEKKIFSEMLEREGKQVKSLENSSKNRHDSVTDLSRLDEMLEKLQSTLAQEHEATRDELANNEPSSTCMLSSQELQEIEEEYRKEVEQAKQELGQQFLESTNELALPPNVVTTTNVDQPK